MPKCHDCPEVRDPKMLLPIYQDGYCKNHWNLHFAGMTNHQRMVEKKRQRTIRVEYKKARELENATNNSLRD